jgi:hypothetical protein
MKKEIVFSKKVKILPWIGKNYDVSSPKILILGMSTYNHDDKPRNRVVEIMIKKLCNAQFKDSFWTKTKNLLAENDDESTKDFWERVSIHEYIQEITRKPSKKDWEDAKEPFIEILNKLQPDIVAVMSFQVYTEISKNANKVKSIKKNGNETDTCIYEINNKSISFCKIKHPAGRGWVKNIWRELFFTFLKKWKKENLK